MRKRLAAISYTVLECYLQENRAQDASWTNMMLALRGIYSRNSIRNSVLVGQDGSLSYMSSGYVCK